MRPRERGFQGPQQQAVQCDQQQSRGIVKMDVGAQSGALDPIKFLVSWQRGESTTTDVLSPEWDFWEAAQHDLEELREQYEIVPLLPADAATGEEIIVEKEADRYAQ